MLNDKNPPLSSMSCRLPFSGFVYVHFRFLFKYVNCVMQSACCSILLLIFMNNCHTATIKINKEISSPKCSSRRGVLKFCFQLQLSPRPLQMQLRRKLLRLVLPVFLLTLLYQLLLTNAYMNGVRIEEIPFGKNQLEAKPNSLIDHKSQSGIQLIAKWERQSSFFHLFHVPYIICFYAAKGKWPFVPPFMQVRVDNAARTFFRQNDSLIRTFCQKWIQIKECFRPILDKTNDPTDIDIETLQSKRCNCDKLIATESPTVYFDKNYIGNVSSETILNTIEFLESFLPPPTKKFKRKNRVRGRVDELDIE